MYKTILLITPFYPPNLGGVETSLATTVALLRKRNLKVFVSSYKYVNKYLFNNLEKYPILQAIHLIPLLLIKTILTLMFAEDSVGVIWGAGFAGGFMAKVCSKLFGIPYVVTTHAIYEGITGISSLHRWILRDASSILCLSEDSKREIDLEQCVVYRTMIDPDLFKPLKVTRSDMFTVLFVGRPIKKKGWEVVEKVTKKLPYIKFIMQYNIKNEDLPYYYNLADLTITAAQYKECFSRVILESLFCGTPVIYSNKDVAVDVLRLPYAIPVTPTVESLELAIEKYASDDRWWVSKEKVRKYAMEEFGEKNLEVFVNAFKPHI